MMEVIFNIWISSSYYMSKLPKWVIDLNKNNKADAYLNTAWNTLYDIKSYKNSRTDNNVVEKTLKGQKHLLFLKT